MQFHLNGFQPGDPALSADQSSRKAGAEMPDHTDVLIVGSGPAGLTLAAQLAQYPDISTILIERKTEPMIKGQADGISCRSMEMFQAFGFAHKVAHEAYQVNETTFWKPNPKNPSEIMRTGRVQDVEDGLSEMPHLILNQARIHDRFLEVMSQSASRLEPDYGWDIVDLDITDADDYPVVVTLQKCDEAQTSRPETTQIKARYVVGCDGARSFVRKSIGLELKGDSANKAWGVMDVLAVTDFPDIRQKSLIQSDTEGTVLIIPREGGYLVRLYVEMESLADGERVHQRNITQDDLISACQKIFHPYQIDVKDVIWWSVYEIGQRLTDRFDNLREMPTQKSHPRIFIAGDACHTHSPKAGQGMNVSMGDSFNLGWKLISVLQGRCGAKLLQSYTNERQQVAQDLIDFDQEWARIIAERSETGDTPEFQRYFQEHGRYTAGVSVRYQPSDIISAKAHQDLASGFDIGMRFHSAPVIRLADAKPQSLGHVIRIDSKWRLFAFADRCRPDDKASKLAKLCAFLAEDARSPLIKYENGSQSNFDMRAILQQSFQDVEIGQMPEILRPREGRFGLVNYEKIFCADHKSGQDIFDMRGINREEGCIVIVRPDQYIAHILPLEFHHELADFFEAIFLPKTKL